MTMKKLEPYENENHRNRRKQQRRRERLEAVAHANGYPTWYKMVTAVLKAAESGGQFIIEGLPEGESQS